MKVLIIYASRNGTAKQAAEMLASKMAHRVNISVCDIHNAPPSPDDFDVTVIGGSIRFGRLDKQLKKYIQSNKQKLADGNSAAFICCGYLKNFEDYKTMQLPLDLSFSLGVHCFGGHLKPDRLHGFDKLFVKIARENILTQDPDKSDYDRNELPELMPDTIYALAEQILRLIQAG